MKRLEALLFAGIIAGASASAHAESIEPISLSSAELDGVTAGQSFLFLGSDALANAEGEGAFVFNFTATDSTSFGKVDGDNFFGFTGSSSESASF